MYDYTDTLKRAAKRLGWDTYPYYDGIVLNNNYPYQEIYVQVETLNSEILESLILRMQGGPFSPVIDFWHAHG